MSRQQELWSASLFHEVLGGGMRDLRRQYNTSASDSMMLLTMVVVTCVAATISIINFSF